MTLTYMSLCGGCISYILYLISSIVYRCFDSRSYMSSRFEERYRQMLVSLNRAGEQGQGLGPGAKSSSPRGRQAS